MKSGLLRTFAQSLLALGFSAFALAPSVATAADMPPIPHGLSAPAAGLKMPAFSLPNATGGNVRAEDLKGKVVIARFWATW